MERDELQETEVAVIGAGPGGYAAAFRAADLGLRTLLVDARESPGGVCLHVGCIPSKALLFVAELLGEVDHARHLGLQFSDPEVNLEKLRRWKEQTVLKLTRGLSQLAQNRGVQFLQGQAQFESSNTLKIRTGSGRSRLQFQHAILATGSRPQPLPGLDFEAAGMLNSTSALELEKIPQTLLVVGGGYIGLELGSVYAALGSQVTLVELTDGLLPGIDRDLVNPLERKIRKLFHGVHVNTRVSAATPGKKGIQVIFDGVRSRQQIFEQVLVAVGRQPCSDRLGLENTDVTLHESGFVQTDSQCRTSDSRILAVGDVSGQPLLAHKALREGKIAAEVIAGQSSEFDNQTIPAVVFTDPEVAWCGLTESEAQAEGREVRVTRFPWVASGRAATMDRSEGLTKMLFDPIDGRILGVGIVGRNAGELIAEGALAIEMAAVAEDLAATIHAHPTLSESMGEAAEAFLGRTLHAPS